MELADSALSAQRHGREDEARRLFEDALEKEVAAIGELEQHGRIEPNYSVLHRSAATLALDCGRLREAEKLAAKALAGDPHAEIAEDLRDIIQQATFHRHLQLKGVELSSDEIQMSLAGEEVGLGIADQHEVLTRIRDSLRLMQRIADRRVGQAFKEDIRGTKDAYRLYTSLPRAASYAVTLRLATSSKQASMPGFDGADAVLDEFIELIRLLNTSRVDQIQEMIPDAVYFRNFMALGRRIAPDGERIKLVGFTTTRQGTQQSVELTRRAIEIPRLSHETELKPTTRIGEIIGQLRYADATNANRILLMDNGKKSPTITVPEGMMDDIVRPMWGSYVRITTIRTGRGLVLGDIALIEEPEQILSPPDK